MTTPQEQETQDALVAHVRDLKNQIAFWKTKYSEDPTNNSNAPNTIETIQRELNGIPNSANW